MARERKKAPPATGSEPKNVGGRPKKARADPGLGAAIDAAGSLGRVAEIAGVTVGAVSIWKRVPQKAVDAIATALHIPRHTLRPDLYDAADQRIPAAPPRPAGDIT